MLSHARRFSTIFRQPVNNAHVLHITDTEGRDFLPFVRKNKFLRYHPDSGLHFHNARGTPYLIFGGDATDRGPHDLETTELLIDFKQRHPGNVFLLAGNREIKNTRFKELNQQQMRERILTTESPFWLPPEMHTTPRTYVKSKIEDKQKGISDIAIEYYLKSLSPAHAQILYLHWMLEKTMGSPHAFRYRKEELKRRSNKKTVTDEEVLQSFIDESMPNGLMGKYLQHAQLGVIIPGTQIMAVHGGLTVDSVGMVPGEAAKIHSATDWIDKLNLWFQDQIQLWINTPASLTAVAGDTALSRAMLPISGQKKTAVTADTLNANRELTEIDSTVIDYLKRNNISVVLHGHQPCGDHPLFLRSDGDEVLFINGDTGYAKFDPSNPDDTIGNVYHSLSLLANPHMVTINVDARLSDDIDVKTELSISGDKIYGDKFVGRLLPGGEVVQCKLPEDDYYRLISQRGFKVTYSTVTEAELVRRLSTSPLRMTS